MHKVKKTAEIIDISEALYKFNKFIQLASPTSYARSKATVLNRISG